MNQTLTISRAISIVNSGLPLDTLDSIWSTRCYRRRCTISNGIDWPFSVFLEERLTNLASDYAVHTNIRRPLIWTSRPSGIEISPVGYKNCFSNQVTTAWSAGAIPSKETIPHQISVHESYQLSMRANGRSSLYGWVGGWVFGHIWLNICTLWDSIDIAHTGFGRLVLIPWKWTWEARLTGEILCHEAFRCRAIWQTHIPSIVDLFAGKYSHKHVLGIEAHSAHS